MANEINIQAALCFQRYSPALQALGNLNISQTGTRCASNVVNVTSSASSTLQIDGSTNMAYVFIKNLDGATWDDGKYVHIALESGITNVLAKLRAGEFCLIPLKASTVALYAKAYGVSAVDLLFCAVQA
jgi:hypothetical protein